ncbi:MAG: benzoyl-CoA 2,3-epoxidase subunit BoxB, partial [Acidimicrobiales bacterium]
RDDWLPTDAEKVHVGSLMKAAFGPGEMAGWIAPPSTGINTLAVDYDYVRI